jgi:capsular exopolysaccharide synthesis family protein
VDQPLKTILVTSPDIGDGKTSVAVNLALSIAQRDKKVILIDDDLRRPKIHKLFNLANEQGLVDLISARAPFDWRTGTKKVGEVNVFTAGDIPPNPTELLSSKKMSQLLSELAAFADVVIIDGPPFIVPDAMILASKVDGVLLVIRPGHTRRSLAKAAMEHIKLVGASVVGVVLNRIPLRGADYYAGNSYLYTYYMSSYGDESKGKEYKNDLEKLRETLLPYVNKVAAFFKHLFETVFKLSPK